MTRLNSSPTREMCVLQIAEGKCRHIPEPMDTQPWSPGAL